MANPCCAVTSSNSNQIPCNSFICVNSAPTVSCTVARNSSVSVSDQQIPPFQNASFGLPPLIEHSFFPDSSGLGNSFEKEVLKDVTGRSVSQKLSTEQILKMAGERFLQFASQKLNNFSMFIHPYISSLSDLSVEDKRDVELTELLLAAAEKVAHQQFDIAIKLLTSCQWVALNDGTPVQRAVFYFAEALKERIVKETRGVGKVEKNIDACQCSDVLSLVAMHRELPFFQVLHLTAVQTILESEEVVVVHFPFALRSLISNPACLKNLLL